MKVPLRWLHDFVDPGLPPAELAHRLTMAGLEAEKIEAIGADWANVYVGLVRAVEPHPNADRLVLADVEAGPHRLTVVTGAPNIRAGQKVPLALVGARLIDGHGETPKYITLKAGSIRGVRSEGMVCSEKELGLSDEHEGIMVLPDDAPLGAPLADYLGDTVIEFEITPNLVHAFSILGIARETAALTGTTFQLPPAVDLAALPVADDDLVTIEAPDLCPRYVGIVIEGIRVGPSPDWLVRRLTAAGLRPINNVVDVTNYVMLEMGQPLHAFDREFLAEGRIVVRRARPGETMETLDHIERRLTPDVLVIADADRAVAIAGVMGGVDSEVSPQTTTVLLEGANFEMKSIRHTRMALKLRTDASSRFERGIDPNLVAPAMARATQLLLDLCPGSRVTAVRDAYPRPTAPRPLAMPFTLIERVLGVRYEPSQVTDVLARLGFQPKLDPLTLLGSDDDLTLHVLIPTWRSDVSLGEDIVEEVARVIGYDTLPSMLPDGDAVPVTRDPTDRLQQVARSVLVAAGGYEVVTYVTAADQALVPFTTESSAEVGFLRAAPRDRLLRLRNPLQADRALLRPTLVPSLLAVAAENLKHQPSVRLFELARVYLPRGRNELPEEVPLAGITLAGQRAPLSRFADPGELDFFDLKGVLTVLLARLGIVGSTVEPTAHPALHPGRAARVVADGRQVALFGELRPDVAAAFGLELPRVGVAEVDLAAVLALQPEGRREVNVPRFLPVQQDFAVVVDETTPAGEVQAALMSAAGPLASTPTLFDVYRGPQIGEGKKSLAYRITFTAPDRALTDAELVKVRAKIEKTLAQRVGGILRA